MFILLKGKVVKKKITKAGEFLIKEMIKRRTAMFDVVTKTGIPRRELQMFFDNELTMTEMLAEKLAKIYPEYSKKYWLEYNEPVLIKEKREIDLIDARIVEQELEDSEEAETFTD